MTVNIAVINESTNITSDQVNAAVSDLNSQISNEFSAAWSTTANVYVPSGSPASSDYQLILMDTYSQGSILGYHELTGFGLPIAYVFYENATNNSTPWTVPASHECLEMLMDPNCNLSVSTNYSPYQDSNGDQTWLFAFEVCDPVQSVAMAYQAPGETWVSNFVYPAWFQSSWSPFETQFDYQEWIYEPFQVGYESAIMTEEVGEGGEGWQELCGDTAPTGTSKPKKQINSNDPAPTKASTHSRPVTQNPFSRRTRFLMDRKKWQKSAK